jgi:DNA-directed RNA polymerase specialized sigma24 family protein
VELQSRARLGDRSTSEEEEAVDAVVVSFLEAASQDRVDAAGAGGYVARSLRNRMIDLHRRATTASGERREVPVGEPADVARYDDDEALARLLDADAARKDVLDAQARAASEGKFTLVRVVSEWLVLAERAGAEPSSREVAAALEISHTTVVESLREFRENYLPRQGHRT